MIPGRKHGLCQRLVAEQPAPSWPFRSVGALRRCPLELPTFHLSMQTYFQPYENDADDLLELLMLVNVFLTFLVTFGQQSISPDRWNYDIANYSMVLVQGVLGIAVISILYSIVMKHYNTIFLYGFGIAKSKAKKAAGQTKEQMKKATRNMQKHANRHAKRRLGVKLFRSISTFRSIDPLEQVVHSQSTVEQAENK